MGAGVRGSGRWFFACLLAIAVLGAGASAAFGHAERLSYYPDWRLGKVPEIRRSGPALVVCKPDSRRRILRIFKGRSRAVRAARARNLKLLKRCRFQHIQAAVDAASNGTRILVLPGVYREEPSRHAPEPDPKCADAYEEYPSPAFDAKPGERVRVPTYEYQLRCPNAQNLIAIIGDGPDTDRRCDRKCNIQIEGTGRRPEDVVISGDRSRLNGIRADRADGIVLTNFLIEFSDFNNIYVLETNGFRIERVISRWSREYGFLSFTSDNGLYRQVEAYGNGDSGIYPGSGPEGHCARYGIEIDRADSHDNTIGWSGTAGNGVYTHDSKFHNNAAGITMDSFAAGHPGMPQDCSKWERNQIYSNNQNFFSDDRDAYCKRPPAERDPKIVCPAFQVPVGTGVLVAGGNGNLFHDNWVWDNWRAGFMQFWVPAPIRGQDPTGQSANDPTNPYDTSHENRYLFNHVGVRPDGTRDPNGVDFWWDEEGRGNCWGGNSGAEGAPPTSDPARLPSCDAPPVPFSPGNALKQARLVPCSTWDPRDNTDPPGCDWFTLPPEPR